MLRRFEAVGVMGIARLPSILFFACGILSLLPSDVEKSESTTGPFTDPLRGTARHYQPTPCKQCQINAPHTHMKLNRCGPPWIIGGSQ